MKKLNLGCGKDIKKGYVNLDCAKLPKVDIVWDIEKFPYPFKENYFDEIYCSHILEHVSDLNAVLEEVYRICKNNSLIKIRVPYFASPSHHNDPTHKRKFAYETFDYFNDKSSYSYYSKVRFEVLKKRLFFLSGSRIFMKSGYSLPIDFFINLAPKIYQRFFCYLFPASEFQILLKVKK